MDPVNSLAQLDCQKYNPLFLKNFRICWEKHEIVFLYSGKYTCKQSALVNHPIYGLFCNPLFWADFPASHLWLPNGYYAFYLIVKSKFC